MVVLACAICTKNGKTLLSRQFVEITKIRIEGLLSAFPKLLGTGNNASQHTFIETENVRYIYQPLESSYIVLVTNKSSNIVEDLDTLHTMAKLVPEYCRNVDEAEICKNAFEILFAFDEVIAMGYKERVSVQQVKNYTSMESHEETRHIEEEKKLIQEAQKKAVAERQRIQKERMVHGPSPSSTGGSTRSPSDLSPVVEPSKPKKPQIKPSSHSGGMDISTKKKPNRGAKLMSEIEGEPEENEVQSYAPPEGIQVNLEEKIIIKADHDGDVSIETKGELNITVDQQSPRAIVRLAPAQNQSFQFKTHPNIDKNLYKNDNALGLKQNARNFPAGNPTGVLKWRSTSQDDSDLPLSITCWPSTSSDGRTYVNMEYEKTCSFDLHNVLVSVPIPDTPTISDGFEGNYHVDRKEMHFEWQIALIDASNSTGSIEFSVPATDSSFFFPVVVDFISPEITCNIEVLDVVDDAGSSIQFSKHQELSVESFQIV